jgi:hypothetical protein
MRPVKALHVENLCSIFREGQQAHGKNVEPDGDLAWCRGKEQRQ